MCIRDSFKDYQLSVSKDKRLSGTWTLEQYEGQYRAAMYAAVKSANPNWKPGQKFDTSILDNVTRESVESTLVKNGNRLVRNSIAVSYTHLNNPGDNLTYQDYASDIREILAYNRTQHKDIMSELNAVSYTHLL